MQEDPLALTPEEAEHIRRDDAMMAAVRAANEANGSTEPYLPPGAIPIPPVVYHAGLGNIAMVKKHLRAGEDVNQADPFGDTPLHAAVKQGAADIVALLLKVGADREARSEDLRPIDLAREMGHAEIVRLLEAE